jgi:hypothetical protein
MKDKIKIRKIGSNQYKARYTNHWLLRLAVLFFGIVGLIYVLCWFYENEPEPTIVSPLPESRIIVKTVYAQEKTTEQEVFNMIVQEFSEFGPKVVTQALSIAYCESKFNEEAENYNNNGTWDYGVFQINDVHGFDKRTRLAAWENINIAKQMYIKNGWKPWTCRKVVQ